jgi:hypothetical protein
VSRIESFTPTSPQTVLPTKTKKVAVKRTQQYSVTVEEKKELTLEQREAKAKEMGVVVPLGLRSTVARSAFLNLYQVPTYTITTVQKKKTRVITEIVEKAVPREIVVRGIASTGYTFASNANQANVDIIPDSIGSQNANLLILVPAGGTEDTISFLLGPSGVRYAALPGSSFDSLNASINYTRLLGRRQTMPGLKTSGTATTDLFTLGMGVTSVYEPGFGPNQIAIAIPSVGWSRSNIGLGNRLCGEKGSEAYCYYADISFSLSETLANIHSQISTSGYMSATIGWVPPIKNLTLSATGSVEGVYFPYYPGGRQDVVFVGSADLSWTPNAKVSLGAGMRFTQQLSTQSDLDWNGFNAYPKVQLKVKLN